MAARRYEISPRVLTSIFQHEKSDFVSPTMKRPCSFLFIIYNPHNTTKDGHVIFDRETTQLLTCFV